MPEDEGTLALDNVITDDDRAIFMMDQISRAARKAFDDRAQPLSLNRTQWRVLAQLIRAPALNQTDIARRLEITSSSSGLEDMTPSRLSDRTRLCASHSNIRSPRAGRHHARVGTRPISNQNTFDAPGCPARGDCARGRTSVMFYSGQPNGACGTRTFIAPALCRTNKPLAAC